MPAHPPLSESVVFVKSEPQQEDGIQLYSEEGKIRLFPQSLNTEAARKLLDEAWEIGILTRQQLTHLESLDFDASKLEQSISNFKGPSHPVWGMLAVATTPTYLEPILKAIGWSPKK